MRADQPRVDIVTVIQSNIFPLKIKCPDKKSICTQKFVLCFDGLAGTINHLMQNLT